MRSGRLPISLITSAALTPTSTVRGVELAGTGVLLSGMWYSPARIAIPPKRRKATIPRRRKLILFGADNGYISPGGGARISVSLTGRRRESHAPSVACGSATAQRRLPSPSTGLQDLSFARHPSCPPTAQYRMSSDLRAQIVTTSSKARVAGRGEERTTALP